MLPCPVSDATDVLVTHETLFTTLLHMPVVGCFGFSARASSRVFGRVTDTGIEGRKPRGEAHAVDRKGNTIISLISPGLKGII